MQAAISGVCYLLRNGRRIQASVVLSPDLVYAYRQRNGLVIYALLSSQAEQLLMQLIKSSAATTTTNAPVVSHFAHHSGTSDYETRAFS